MCSRVIKNYGAKLLIFDKKSKFFPLQTPKKLLLLQYYLLQLSSLMLHDLIFSAFQFG